MSGESGVANMAIQLLFSGEIYKVVVTCIELNLFDIMSKAGCPISPSDIASQLNSTNPNAPQMINRLLQLLASYDIVSFSSSSSKGDEEEENMYGPTPLSNLLLNTDDSLAAITRLFSQAAFNNSWVYMKDAILNGGVPFEKANGMPFYEYMGANPEFHDSFFRGITLRNKMAITRIVETYKGFQGLSSLVDVGGAHGFTLSMIISKYPNIKGINFDLPYIIAAAPSYPGIEHVVGDMFVSVPKAEAMFLKMIIHNWDDENCIKLLKNCYNAIPENGKVIVVERLRPAVPNNASPESRFAFHMDCHMMSHHNGKERTEKEFRHLAISAGFQGFTLHTCFSQFYIMELLKIFVG